jgi:sugar fermentation stimulation protein A
VTCLSRLTRDVRLARFVDRPNRFVVHCTLDDGKPVRAHMPNPGRMWELLFPGVLLWLAPRQRATGPQGAGAPKRATDFTVVAVERDGAPVFLHTHASNEVASRLIDQGLVPGLEGTQVIAKEVTVGRSRFDLLLRHRGSEVLGEVKSVTLFGHGTAMFPDAPTTRGQRHLVELAKTAQTKARPVVLFLVHTRAATRFLPDYHTDLEFSRTLLSLRHRLHIVAAAIGWRPALGLPRKVERLEVDWPYLEREAHDSGAYLLVMHLTRPRAIMVGKLGEIAFEAGYWVYVGSAMGGLAARTNRHLRKRKRFHWHVDYLRNVATEVRALPIRSSRRLECTLADDLGALLRPGPRGFGSSDCDCATHLFHHGSSPLQDVRFVKLLLRHRMAPPPPTSQR